MNKIKYFFAKLLFAPLSYMPLPWLQNFGGWLGRLLLRFNKKRLHIARCNIKACFPELSEQEQEQLLLKNAEETGKWFVEMTYVWFRDPDLLGKLVTIKNPEVMQNAFDQGRGVVLILPHLGNWEFLNFWVPQNFPTATFYRPMKSEFLDYLIFKGRTRGTKLFKADSGALKGAFKFLKQGNVMVVLSDHLPTMNAGVYAPFFNIPALTGKLSHTLARINQSEVVLTATIRKPQGQGFEAVFYPVEGMHGKDPVEAATHLNKAIEMAIRINPEQYQWVYRRFAHPPEGAKDIYS